MIPLINARLRARGVIRSALVSAALLLLAACATEPPAPLMIPLGSQGHDWGYTERPVSEQRVIVTFLTPQMQVNGLGTARDAAVELARNEATDLAMGHAAELAKTRNLPGFRIIDSHTDTDSTVDLYDDWGWGGGGWGPGWGPGWGWRHSGWGWGGCWHCWDYPPQAWIRGRAIITVDFEKSLSNGDFNATDVLNRIHTLYPHAYYP